MAESHPMALVTLPLRNDGLPRLPRSSVVWRGVLCGVAALAVAVALVRVVSPAAPSATVTHAAPAATQSVYPYESTTRVGPWGFTTRHAADYIAWRFFERDVTFSATMPGPNGTAARFGDPSTWATHAAGLGFKVDTVARAGAIAQWNAGEQGAGGAGHVAYVERVNPDGSVVVSEFDWDVKNGYSQRTLVRAPRYIHVQDL
jgi:surface antigen